MLIRAPMPTATAPSAATVPVLSTALRVYRKEGLSSSKIDLHKIGLLYFIHLIYVVYIADITMILNHDHLLYIYC